jgi:hypothetical protein
MGILDRWARKLLDFLNPPQPMRRGVRAGRWFLVIGVILIGVGAIIFLVSFRFTSMTVS